MRILSQGGMVFNDIPYEGFCFGISKDENTDKFSIIASDAVMERSGFTVHGVLAKYSTEAKAKRAMNMLHDTYMVHFMVKVMSEQQKAVFISSMSEEEQIKLYGIFKFPEDNAL